MIERQPNPAESLDSDWTSVIRPVSGWFDVRLAELWHYRDLVMLFVRRDFVAVYKQTVLGLLWYLIQPLLTTVVFTVIFHHVANLPTDGLPPVLFYLSGIVVWRYFSDCLVKTSNTFVGNARMFGKVYFPRLSVPISVVVSNLISFGIQIVLFALILAYFVLNGESLRLNISVVLLPLLVLQMAAFGLGCGIIISSLTTKYRDLAQLVGFGMQLWMYLTPVVYPASLIPEKWRFAMALNPMFSVTEAFRYMFFGTGTVDFETILISWVFTLTVLCLGIMLFSRVEKNFMDVV